MSETERFEVVKWDDEVVTLFYIVDSEAPEEEQPFVIATCYDRGVADKLCRLINGLKPDG